MPSGAMVGIVPGVTVSPFIITSGGLLLSMTCSSCLRPAKVKRIQFYNFKCSNFWFNADDGKIHI